MKILKTQNTINIHLFEVNFFIVSFDYYMFNTYTNIQDRVNFSRQYNLTLFVNNRVIITLSTIFKNIFKRYIIQQFS